MVCRRVVLVLSIQFFPPPSLRDDMYLEYILGKLFMVTFIPSLKYKLVLYERFSCPAYRATFVAKILQVPHTNSGDEASLFAT
jgi:hypothetical protein